MANGQIPVSYRIPVHPALLLTASPRWGDAAGKMTAVNFTKKQNAMTGGSSFIASTSF